MPLVRTRSIGEKSTLVNVNTVLRIIEKYLAAFEECETDEDGYMIGYSNLTELGLLGEGDTIISDSFHDIECVNFVKKVLRKIIDEIRSI